MVTIGKYFLGTNSFTTSYNNNGSTDPWPLHSGAHIMTYRYRVHVETLTSLPRAKLHAPTSRSLTSWSSVKQILKVSLSFVEGLQFQFKPSPSPARLIESPFSTSTTPRRPCPQQPSACAPCELSARDPRQDHSRRPELRWRGRRVRCVRQYIIPVLSNRSSVELG